MTVLDKKGTGTLRRALHRAGLLARSRALRRLTRLAERLPTSGNTLDIFHDGETLFERMFEDLSQAKRRISVEMYMILNDAIGRQFVRELSERARAGVEVRLIYDAIGCFGTSRHLFQQLVDAGGEVLEYHPVAPWRARFALFRRNHRKTIVIDGCVAYTGGANIGDWWVQREGGPPPWRDSHARVEGPAASDLEHLFEESWFTETAQMLDLPVLIPRESRAPDPEEAQVFVIAALGPRQRRVRSYYLTAIDQARETIDITSAYFIPDRAIRAALYRALERGVRVRLLVPRYSDVRLTLWACQAFFTRFLKRGMEIYTWDPSILHAKTAVVDGDWSTLGTSNLDHLSLNYNLESNLAILDVTTAESLAEQFQADLASSTRIQLEAWAQRSFGQRLKEAFASLFRSVL